MPEPARIPLSRRLMLTTMANAAATVGVGFAGSVRGNPPPGTLHPGSLSLGRPGGEATKLRAMADYRSSLQAFGGQLSSTFESLQSLSCRNDLFQADILIIGSGYGASVCAARLAAAKSPDTTLCVLERGKEWVPGTFHDTFPEVRRESMRSLFGRDKRSVRNPTGLLNVLQGDDISVFSANALGGTSLINANVAIRPDADVFQQACWPLHLSQRSFLDPYLDLAACELGVEREPIDITAKMRLHRLAAENLRDLGAHYEAALLTITRSPDLGAPLRNRQGMIQRPCTSCGDCMTGCNVGAKNTLPMNYLPMAKRSGALIFTRTEVERIEKSEHGYLVHWIHYPEGPKSSNPVRGTLRCRVVILGAGSLGSTEILLRSQNDSFRFSDRLGHSWSGNGDILGFVRGVDVPTKMGGVGATDTIRDWIGPSIESTISYPDRSNLLDRVVVQDGVAPSAYRMFISVFCRDLGLNRSHVMLVSGHDGAQGQLSLDTDGKISVRWPGIKESPYRQMARQEIHRVARAVGGEYHELAMFRGAVGTVHPLGGCSIGHDACSGVVNHRGQVFGTVPASSFQQESSGDAIHAGLYVVDGAILPSSLGVNPLLTITALAERIAESIHFDPQFADLFATRPLPGAFGNS